MDRKTWGGRKCATSTRNKGEKPKLGKKIDQFPALLLRRFLVKQNIHKKKNQGREGKSHNLQFWEKREKSITKERHDPDFIEKGLLRHRNFAVRKGQIVKRAEKKREDVVGKLC